MNTKQLAIPLRLKSIENNGLFSGYASVFKKIDSQNEVVLKGAFQRTLKKWNQINRTPALLWMHDPSQPIGVWQLVKEDSNGLFVEGRLAVKTQKGAEAYELLRLKALTGLSIGYRVVKSHIDTKHKVRVLTDLDLFEISLVTFPANDAARIQDVKDTNTDKKLLALSANRLRKAAHTLTVSSKQ